MTTATRSWTRAQFAAAARRVPARTIMTIGGVAAVVGALAFLWALNGNAARAWQAYHVSFVFFAAVSQAMVIFAASQKLTKGHWAGLIIRFAEAQVAFLVVLVV